MPQCLKLRAGKWEWDPSLGEQCAADYDRVIWNAPRPPYEQWTVDNSGNVVEVTTPISNLRAAATERVRMATQAHILATYPDWYQRDCALGVYPTADAEQCRDDIADCVEASNAAEDAIAAATDAAGVTAAEAGLALPKIGGAA